MIDPRHAPAPQLLTGSGLPTQVIVIDSNGIVLQVSESSGDRPDDRLVFPSVQHGIGQSYFRILDSLTTGNAERAKIAAGVSGILAGATSTYSLEHTWRSQSGDFWLQTIVIPLQVAGSGGAVIICIDISERKNIAARLAESESEYLLMLNATTEGIYQLNASGICTFCNATAARLLGYTDPNQMIGQSIHEIHHHSRADGTPYPAAECKVAQAFRTGRGTSADDEVFFRADGSRFPVEYQSDPIRDGDKVTGAVVTFLDITARKNLQMQLLQSQKMEAVGRLAGGVAHDFNNALQIILTYGEMVEESLTQEFDCFDHNQQILAAARRAAALTRQLLAFSRQQLLRPTVMNLSEVAENMGEMIRRMIGEHINLHMDVSLDVKPVSVDRAHIEQLLMNLAINARDAMPFGGDLFISTANINVDARDPQAHKLVAPGTYVMLTVRDTGIGMTQATQDRVFEPFFTTKEPGKGTGLGLSTVHGLVEQSGGYIAVTSELGQGAEFRIYLKALEDASDMIQASKQWNPPNMLQKGSGTILLVEDEDALRSIIGKTLRTNGYTVLEARDGLSGIDLARTYDHHIDLVLTDVMLPRTSGRGVADQLRVSRPDTKVIYMSGYTDDIIAQHGLLSSNVILLEKPFSRAFLLDKIHETLGAA